MTDLRKAAEMALEALKQAKDRVADWGAYASNYFQTKNDLQGDLDEIQAQITALRQALAQPEQGPVGYKEECWACGGVGVENCVCAKSASDYFAPKKQKPLAWISGGGVRELFESGKTEVFAVQDYETTGTTPLYTAPPKQPEQEPVAWDGACVLGHCDSPAGCETSNCCRANYTAPSKREWVGLTDEDRCEFAAAQYGWEDLLAAAEAKLKEKNA